MGEDLTQSGKAGAVNAEQLEHTPDDPGRRHALRKLGGYALSMAPAMMLLTPGVAGAQGRGSVNGNGRGNGGGSGQSVGSNGPGCANPAWELGLQRAGHSGC